MTASLAVDLLTEHEAVEEACEEHWCLPGILQWGVWEALCAAVRACVTV